MSNLLTKLLPRFRSMNLSGVNLGVEIFESIDPKYIGKRGDNCFHVKGGVVTSENERQLNKKLKKSSTESK